MKKKDILKSEPLNTKQCSRTDLAHMATNVLYFLSTCKQKTKLEVLTREKENKWIKKCENGF